MIPFPFFHVIELWLVVMITSSPHDHRRLRTIWDEVIFPNKIIFRNMFEFRDNAYFNLT